MKGIASEGLNSTPYIRIKWENGVEETALFDTGAQWSLICEHLLTEQEKVTMEKLNRRYVGGGYPANEYRSQES